MFWFHADTRVKFRHSRECRVAEVILIGCLEVMSIHHKKGAEGMLFKDCVRPNFSARLRKKTKSKRKRGKIRLILRLEIGGLMPCLTEKTLETTFSPRYSRWRRWRWKTVKSRGSNWSYIRTVCELLCRGQEMVYAFLIHSLASGPCRVLFSSTFMHEPALHGAVEDERTLRKEQLLAVAQRVQSEFSFYLASGSTAQENSLGLSSTEELLSQLETGVFRLSSGNPFEVERIVLWKGLANCGFTLVCEKDENRLVAENVLGLVIRHLQEYCRIIQQPTGAILKVDKVAVVVHHLLPNGQLLFMNSRFLRQVEKELEQAMNMK